MLPIETGAPPPDMLVTGHYKARPTYAVFRRHGSGNWLLTYTVAGRGLFRQPGLELYCAPGDIVLLAPGALHDYSVPSDGSWEFVWAHFHPRPAWLSWWQLPEVGTGLFQASLQAPAVRRRARSAMLALNADACAPETMRRSQALKVPAAGDYSNWSAAGPDTLQSELALNGLEEVLLLAVRECAQGRQHPLDERVQRVLDRIANDLAGPHDLHALAREVNLSPSRLAHLFKQEAGDTIISITLTMRLRRAARLLEYTGLSVNEVAEEVGFNSSFYFSRQFRRHVGTSPRAYRAAHQHERDGSPHRG
jgi:AraC family transcriptional regulator of arabinose operon